jgi:hypothetical protein
MEWPEVDLPKCSRLHYAVLTHSIMLLIVADEILDSRGYTIRLETVHVFGRDVT